MKRFEYKPIYDLREEESNKLGEKGWELVAFTPKNDAWFKREL